MAAAAVDPPRRPAVPLGHPIGWDASAGRDPQVVLEVFVDWCCPFSKRIYDRLVGEVIPHYKAKGPGLLKVVLQMVPQPWHPQSGSMHEAVIAVRQIAGLAKANEYIAVLLGRRDDFVDVKTQDMSRNQIYQALAKLATEIGVEEQAVMQQLSIDTSKGQNSGNQATRVLKLYVKAHRQCGIHVTPTCRVNGMVVDTSSSWTLQQWQEFLDPMLAFAGPAANI